MWAASELTLQRNYKATCCTLSDSKMISDDLIAQLCDKQKDR